MIVRCGWRCCPSCVGSVGAIAVLMIAFATSSVNGQDPFQPPGAEQSQSPGETPAEPVPPSIPPVQPLRPGGPPGAPPVLGPGSAVQPVSSQTDQIVLGLGGPAPQRYSFTIDPKSQVKDLLPTPPKSERIVGPVLTDDLSKVPEIGFAARAKVDPKADMRREAAHQLAKINHLNAKKADAFMAELLASRPDLAGMPFVMGDDCRSDKERMAQFASAVATVRQAMGAGVTKLGFIAPQTGSGPSPGGFSGVITPELLLQGTSNTLALNGDFWNQFNTLCTQQDAANNLTKNKAQAEVVGEARIAALMQILAPESAELRLGLVKFLTAMPHVEATKALARMAIYSPEEDIRSAAVTALKVRREKDYTGILVAGLRYPWPAVANRAADAIAKLERKDLIPEFVSVLESDDPRLPVARDVDGKKVSFVREMVRVNHHRNCVMCHAPGEGVGAAQSELRPGVMTAEVAIQGQPLPSFPQGYMQSSSPDLLVRIDVTYLRQDFSAKLAVEDAHPWPEQQRFDFFVRERKLSDEESVSYRDEVIPREEGVFSPYHRAALAALREITGKDAAPTAEAWRKLLKLPPKAERVD